MGRQHQRRRERCDPFLIAFLATCILTMPSGCF
jgi:hypothetical protein